jgi:hypothetical protein
MPNGDAALCAELSLYSIYAIAQGMPIADSLMPMISIGMP